LGSQPPPLNLLQIDGLHGSRLSGPGGGLKDPGAAQSKGACGPPSEVMLMAPTFVAIDVETANPDRSSLCQLGAVRVEDGAIAESGLDVPGWLTRVGQPIDPTNVRIAQEGNPDGPMAGEVVVFTGALAIRRAEAAKRAAGLGCEVRDSVSEKITVLVVGQQDLERLGGYTKSTKQRKAERLIVQGSPISILSEADFMRLTACAARER